MSERTICLQLNDGTREVVPYELMLESKLITSIIEEDDDETPEIPLLKLSKRELDRVVAFLKLQKVNPIAKFECPIKARHISTLVPQPMADLLVMPVNDLCDLLLASNWLDIPSLTDLCCATLATVMYGLTPDEMDVKFKANPMIEAFPPPVEVLPPAPAPAAISDSSDMELVVYAKTEASPMMEDPPSPVEEPPPPAVSDSSDMELQ